MIGIQVCDQPPQHQNDAFFQSGDSEWRETTVLKPCKGHGYHHHMHSVTGSNPKARWPHIPHKTGWEISTTHIPAQPTNRRRSQSTGSKNQTVMQMIGIKMCVPLKLELSRWQSEESFRLYTSSIWEPEDIFCRRPSYWWRRFICPNEAATFHPSVRPSRTNLDRGKFSSTWIKSTSFQPHQSSMYLFISSKEKPTISTCRVKTFRATQSPSRSPPPPMPLPFWVWITSRHIRASHQICGRDDETRSHAPPLQ